jgi:hypothetical protein
LLSTYQHLEGTYWIHLQRSRLQFYPQGKGKVHPRTGHEGPYGERCSSTLSLSSTLDRVGGQRHAPAAITPGKTRYPLYRRLGGPQGRSRQVRKISPLTGIRSPDRPARSQSLYRLSYPGPYPQGTFVHSRLGLHL